MNIIFDHERHETARKKENPFSCLFLFFVVCLLAFPAFILSGIVPAGAFVSPVSPAAAGPERPLRAADIGLIDAVRLGRAASLWKVLDARPKSEWREGHIPGSNSFSWEEFTGTDEGGVKRRIRSPGELAEALGKMGIDENAAVVVYGDADESWGAEGWACWVLAWLGHKGPIRVLDGGIQSWSAHGLPLAGAAAGDARDASPAPATDSAVAGDYRYVLRPELDIRASELEEKAGALVLIDTRSNMEWWAGRIPGAVHIPWTDFFTGKERRPIEADALRKLLADHGVDTTKPVVYYCAVGVRSAYAWMVHQLSGLPPARNYEGGMEDWNRRMERPPPGK